VILGELILLGNKIIFILIDPLRETGLGVILIGIIGGDLGIYPVIGLKGTPVGCRYHRPVSAGFNYGTIITGRIGLGISRQSIHHHSPDPLSSM
jgi:hypothetical protein